MASSKEGTIHLHLRATKPPAIHGEGGISAKASGDGHASHYYSMTRLETTGEFFGGGKSQAFRGESWFDHEWATNQLAPGQVGWDWLSVQFDDGSELMLYQMRLENGSADPASSGTLIAADGTSAHLPSNSFQMTPTAYWKSGRSGAKYPIGWRVDLPERDIHFTVRAAVENQELSFPPLVYWEGAIEVTGTRAGQSITGRGYLELTGYAGTAARVAAMTLALDVDPNPPLPERIRSKIKIRSRRGLTPACAARNGPRHPLAVTVYGRAGDGEQGRRDRLSCSCARENRADSSGCASSAVGCVS